jgi:hypothetical protein
VLTAVPSDRADAWAAQASLSRQLAAWAATSIAAGSALALAGQVRGNRAMGAFGAQTAAWGAIDLAIAGVGEIRRRARLARLADPHDPMVADNEWRSLRRILLVNVGLDVGYVAVSSVGLAWSRRRAHRSPVAAGHLAAVAVQGCFLLVFDSWHARAAAAGTTSGQYR